MAITTIADMNYLNDVYNSLALPYPQINIPVSIDAGCTMEIQNYSPFVLQIYNGKTLVESLPPYSWLICDYIDKATANIVSPASLPLATGAFITTNVLSQKMSRQRGDFTLPLTQTVNTPVITPTGQTLAVAGSMNVANVVNATITQAAGTTLAISSVGSITENVTTSSTILNETIATNGLVMSNVFTYSLPALSAGQTWNGTDDNTLYGCLNWQLGYYSRASLVGYTANSESVQMTGTLNANDMITFGSPAYQTLVSSTGGYGLYAPLTDLGLSLLNRSDIAFQNTGTTSTSSTTVQIRMYLLPAEVSIDNTSSNPAQSQQAVGEFDSQYPFSVANTTVSQIILHGSIGGYIKYLWITATNTSTSPEFFQITNGGNSIAEIYVPPATTANGNLGLLNIAMPFGTGILNGEVDIIPNNTGLSVIGYSIVAQQSGATIPTTLS